jgi:integrase/recombinase XerD
MNDAETRIATFPATGPEQVPLHLTPDMSLKATIGAFVKYMRYEGFSQYTVQAFTSDLNLLGRYLGIGQPIGQVTTKNLNDFLNWLQRERGVPCSPKTYARRVTTLKVFFKWLHKGGILVSDPGAPVIHYSVRSPLPEVLTEDQVNRLLAAGQQVKAGAGGRKGDARPLLLLSLILDTGIKKGEAMGINLNHIDRSDSERPALFVRYRSPAKRYKERVIPLDPTWLSLLDEYLGQYNPQETLFTCTPRNLEYILRDLEELAEVAKPVSFENLRWTSSVHSFIKGANTDELREKLGLSEITWRETLSKIERLAQGLSPRQPNG